MPVNDPGSLMQNKLVRTSVYIAAILLLVWAGYDIYQRYQTMQQLEVQIEKAMQPIARTAPENRGTAETRKVASIYLFGKQKVQTAPKPEVIDAPITRLKLRLIGVIAADNPEDSKAVVQIDNRQVMIFKADDTVPKTNAEIHQIQPTQILLMRNGKLERLVIDRPELDSDIEKNRQIIVDSNSRAGIDNLLTPTELPQATNSRSKSSGRPAARQPGVNPPPPFEVPPLQPPARKE